MRRGDLDTLADFRTKAPGMPYAHPAPDHFLPLFIALGAVDGRTDRLADGVDGYSVGLSRRVFALYRRGTGTASGRCRKRCRKRCPGQRRHDPGDAAG